MNKGVDTSILLTLDAADKALTAREIADRIAGNIHGVTGGLYQLFKKDRVERSGRWGEYRYRITETGHKLIGDETAKFLTPKKPARPKPSEDIMADQIVSAIFKKIEEVVAENQSLKEENKQLRVLAGKNQSKPVTLPNYITSAIIKHGD